MSTLPDQPTHLTHPTLQTHPTQPRVAKCHGYDGYIRVKIFKSRGKKSERTHNMTKLGLF